VTILNFVAPGLECAPWTEGGVWSGWFVSIAFCDSRPTGQPLWFPRSEFVLPHVGSRGAAQRRDAPFSYGHL